MVVAISHSTQGQAIKGLAVTISHSQLEQVISGVVAISHLQGKDFTLVEANIITPSLRVFKG